MKYSVLIIALALLACETAIPEWTHSPYQGGLRPEPLERSIEICDLKARVIAHKGDSYDPVDPDAYNAYTYKDCMLKKGWRATRVKHIATSQ